MMLARTRPLLTAVAVCMGGTLFAGLGGFSLSWPVRVNLRLSLSATSSATSPTSPWTGSIQRIPVVSEMFWSSL